MTDENETPSLSPLATVGTDDLTKSFEADPLLLSLKVIDETVVRELQRRRNVFAAKEAADKLKPANKRTKAEPQTPAEAAKLDKPAEEFSVEDL